MIHELKTWPDQFRAVIHGRKRYEIRKTDRPFAVGDYLRLREYDNAASKYTGRNALVSIDYMTMGGEWGIPEGVCVMSIQLVSL